MLRVMHACEACSTATEGLTAQVDKTETPSYWEVLALLHFVYATTDYLQPI